MRYNDIAIKAIDWNTAIYVRISEEERIKSLDNSIANQKQILTSYANKHELNIVKVFEDEGKKGGNFNRPAFQEMLTEIEKGNINCVLVKDLSRFGREHIEGDYYLEKLFPAKGVRFISLLEGIDSVADPERMGSIEIPIINLFNEQYLRQVSNSTKASLNIKRKEGQFVGSLVPYGYVRSPEDKHKLIVDEYAKTIVEEIYRLYLNYTSLCEIARILDYRGIPNPASYRRKLIGSPGDATQWNGNTVRNIITQPIYTGDMVQGRSYSYNHKIGKREPLPKSQWTAVENTHEPIIDKNTFEKAQAFIERHARPAKRKHDTEPSILAGFLVCKECGRKMQRNISVHGDKRYRNFLCSTYKQLGAKTCSSHLVSEEIILDISLTTINTIIQSMTDVERAIINNQRDDINRMVAKLNHDLFMVKTDLDKIEKLKAGLYGDYKLEIISLADYKEMKKRFEDKQVILREKILQLEEQIQMVRSDTGLDSKAVVLFKKYKGIEKLNREIVGALINEIVVDKDRNITINFKFQDEIKKYCSFFEYQSS